MLFRFKPIVSFIALMFLFSCNTDKICNEDRISYLRVGFYGIQKIDDVIKMGTLKISDITVYGIGRSDSLIYDNVALTGLVLPLSQMNDSSVFRIKFGSASTDEYIVKYIRSQFFVNYECGFRIDFEIDTILSTHNKFDSLYFNTRTVTNTNEEHIKVFFKQPDVVTPVEP